MIWIVLYLLFAFASGVIWFNIFKHKACKEHRHYINSYNHDPEKNKEIEYNITWVHILSFPCLIALSLIGFVVGLIIAEDEDVSMPAFTIKAKKK